MIPITQSDCRRFYGQLFAPLEDQLGPRDKLTQAAIIGFDVGGPLNFCTFGWDSGAKFITYVSCELAVRPEQKPADFGRYELLASCDDFLWVRRVLTRIGRMTEDEVFGDEHTIDIATWVAPEEPIQGVYFEKTCTTQIDGERFGILRCIGITRKEMEFKLDRGTEEFMLALKHQGVYPNTETKRKSIF